MKGPTGAPIQLEGYDTIPKVEFDQLARDKKFKEGPHIDSFGDGYGDPYSPHRTIWGTLKDGRKVRSET